MHENLGILVNLSICFALALVFGLITERLRLSPIVGYLLAGFTLGPHTPGLVADPEMARQFAEIGVVLLMFGVGLHFDVKDLLAVRRIAIPGAAGQILIATGLGAAAAVLFGLNLGAGLVLGMAISVASTVVLVRVLSDNDVLHTPQGHIAVGWLIVEDIFTVLALVILPALADSLGVPGEPSGSLGANLVMAVLKIAGLVGVVFAVGRKIIPWLLAQVARTRSRELFTLAILALALAVATGSAVFFGVSMALGAFLAGMVVGQTEVSHQAGADALPMKDAFAVLFFVSVGMLFDPSVVLARPGLLAALLGIVLVAKPLTALVIVWALRYSVPSALVVAVGLAQIGEFSFLLADEAMRLVLLSAEGQSLLVVCALISITLNPLLFRGIRPLENWMRRRTRLWRILSARSEHQGVVLNTDTRTQLGAETPSPSAVVVGYGPVGQTACRILQKFGVQPVVVDLNLDAIRRLQGDGKLAIYGDGSRREILESAGIHSARYLLVTIPDVLARTLIILAAKDLNPELRIFTRARYLQERAWLEEMGASEVCAEEAETAFGLAVRLLHEINASGERIQQELRQIERDLGLAPRPAPRGEGGDAS